MPGSSHDTGAGGSASSSVGETSAPASVSLGNDLIDATPGTSARNGTLSEIVDLGHNLLSIPGTNGCAQTIVNGADGDRVGTTSDPIGPLLGPLASNGGTTQTEALRAGRPAIGTGSAALCKAVPVNDRASTASPATRPPATPATSAPTTPAA